MTNPGRRTRRRGRSDTELREVAVAAPDFDNLRVRVCPDVFQVLMSCRKDGQEDSRCRMCLCLVEMVEGVSERWMRYEVCNQRTKRYKEVLDEICK